MLWIRKYHHIVHEVELFFYEKVHNKIVKLFVSIKYFSLNCWYNFCSKFIIIYTDISKKKLSLYHDSEMVKLKIKLKFEGMLIRTCGSTWLVFFSVLISHDYKIRWRGTWRSII